MSQAQPLPDVRFPTALPISGSVDELRAALESEQVLVVVGATGSGKTTQLPKICLTAGRGTSGMIAHTQPRRLAARAVAERIASELGVRLGDLVGYRVRFDDRSGRRSRVLLQTDGILLNAIRHDRRLEAYDTIIIDEAHERSVNVDLLLAFLKPLLRRRPDLKLIITSATVDSSAFSRHFDSAPVIEIEGRSFPVEIRYQPPDPEEELHDAVVRACLRLAEEAETARSSVRDILVFLPGEQAIRDAEAALRRAGPESCEVLPLYARLSARRQQRIFRPGERTRIVLATNVAETSLTVPRIGYVVDSGLARVRRYSARHRIDTLRIEPIAKANAAQRAGRCGRLAPGVCLRLGSATDFDQRPEFTDPEILRTNLAGVMLRIRTLGYGDIERLPFIDPPDPKSVNDARRLLSVLGAIDEQERLTRAGRLMARLPIEPRLARVLLEGRRRGCLGDCLVIAAALSAGDPREKGGSARTPAPAPAGPNGTVVRNRGESSRQRKTNDSDGAPSGPLTDKRSDFVTLLNLWKGYHEARARGRARTGRFCRLHNVSESRMREWLDVHEQLGGLVADLGWRVDRAKATYPRLHKALLSGFVDYIGHHDGRGDYRAMHDARTRLFPGSAAAQARPPWVMAAEHVATARNYLRTVARIEPGWIDEVAPHLVRQRVGDPRWDRSRGRAVAPLARSIFGLALPPGAPVDFSQIDPVRAREILIREGLAPGELGGELAFVVHNNDQKALILEWEARRRSRDLYIGDRGLATFYAERIPDDVCSAEALRAWAAQSDGNGAPLRADWRDLITHDVSESIEADYPDSIECAGQALELCYRYEPGDIRDGVTLALPAVLIDVTPTERLDWLVPGYLREKVIALLRSLPKELRRPLVPLPDMADRLMPGLEARFGTLPLANAIAEQLAGVGHPVPADAFSEADLPTYLKFRIELIDQKAECIDSDRSIEQLRQRHGGVRSRLAGSLGEVADGGRLHTDWDFGDLDEAVTIDRYGTRLALFPAVVAAGRGVRLELLPPGPAAQAIHRNGVAHLLAVTLSAQTGLLRGRIRGDRPLLLAYHGHGTSEDLANDVLAAAVAAAFELDTACRSAGQFRALRDGGRAGLADAGERVIETVRQILETDRELRAALERTRSVAPTAADDIEAQLARLLCPRFIATTPPEWLAHLPRFLRGALLRCESLRYRNTVDARHCTLARKAEARWLDYDRALPSGWPRPPAVEQYRWLTEELRVSLFAQSLGTSVSVSGKRLERYWLDNVR